MGAKQTILVVDDDPHLREVVRFALESAGFATVEAEDGEAALARFAEKRPDLIVLDVLMPELDGTEVCRRIRRGHGQGQGATVAAAGGASTPIVFLSSRDDDVDRIVGLELGGDDYVTKPFSPRELVARVRAVLRRAATQTIPAADTAGLGSDGGSRKSRVLARGPLKLDLDRFRASWDEREVVLTVTEFAIVRTLMSFPGKVYTRGELMDGAYDDGTVVSDRTIDSHVRRVRQKFAEAGGDPVSTVHGLGYRLTIEG